MYMFLSKVFLHLKHLYILSHYNQDFQWIITFYFIIQHKLLNNCKVFVQTKFLKVATGSGGVVNVASQSRYNLLDFVRKPFNQFQKQAKLERIA